nr:PilN domain-containing protein [Zoogloeaceae bacterium]
MASNADQWRLFGLDLRGLVSLWRQGWAEAMQWPALRPLVPRNAVGLRRANGSLEVWRGDQQIRHDRATRVEHAAIEVPEDCVLVRQLRLPWLAADEIAAAVAIEVAAASPFAPEMRISGWRADAVDGGVVVTIAMCSRIHVERALEAFGQSGGPAAGRNPEVWVMHQGLPVVLEGFGEAGRFGAQRRQLIQLALLCASAVVLLGALVASPVLQARQRVFDAQSQFDALRVEAAEAVRARDGLALLAQRQQSLAAWQADSVPVMPLLDRLTRLLPDDAYLVGLELRAGTVTVSGLAHNAAGLMEVFGTQPDFADVRPSGISRDRLTNLETFRIEFKPRLGGVLE